MQTEQTLSTTAASTAAVEQETAVPLGALQQFLAAIRVRDLDGAKALAFQSAHPSRPQLPVASS